MPIVVDIRGRQSFVPVPYLRGAHVCLVSFASAFVVQKAQPVRILSSRQSATAVHLAMLLRRVLQIQAMGSVRSFCFHRLVLLEQKFNLHVMMNADKEFLAQKSAPHRDFYNGRKVLLLLDADVSYALFTLLQEQGRRNLRLRLCVKWHYEAFDMGFASSHLVI